MMHLGDITKINGAQIAPVDIITFGSPCQDLSVAGAQKGLAGSRSGLFREAVRIIKEMRYATDGKQPRFAVWENVPGAFSSNGGTDFQSVILELCKIPETQAPVIPVPADGWPNAGQLADAGDGSIAWRVIDAQFHGVPQRRRRIILVCDFTGQCAGQILFEPRGLPGYSAEGVCPGEDTAGTVDGSIDRAVLGFNGRQDPVIGNVAGTLNATLPQDQCVTVLESHPPSGRINVRENGVVQTLTAKMQKGCADAPLVLQGGSDNLATFGKSGFASYKEGAGVLRAAGGDNGGGSETLIVNKNRYVIRRLTPTECARLQGFPDWWANLPTLTDMDDADFEFWQEVRHVQAEIKGKKYKLLTKKQVVRWYNNLHTDSAEYKMWGNGVALPVVRIPLHGMAQAGAKTMGSLFDGSGGFPLAGLLEGITTLWASEVEPYPIAVTRWNFSGKARVLLSQSN